MIRGTLRLWSVPGSKRLTGINENAVLEGEVTLPPVESRGLVGCNARNK